MQCTFKISIHKLRATLVLTLVSNCTVVFQQVVQHTPNTNPDLEDEEQQHVPHSQAQPQLHVATPQHPHMPSLEDIPPAQQSPTLQSRQEMPMSPESPPPTMGSPCRKHSITPPPNITVHDINSQSDMTVVATPSCHMMEDKPVHQKRRNGDPDGIALGKSLSMLLVGHAWVGSLIGVLVVPFRD